MRSGGGRRREGRSPSNCSTVIELNGGGESGKGLAGRDEGEGGVAGPQVR